MGKKMQEKREKYRESRKMEELEEERIKKQFCNNFSTVRRYIQADIGFYLQLLYTHR